VFSAPSDSLLERAAMGRTWRADDGSARDELVRSLILALGQSLNVVSAVLDGDGTMRTRGSRAETTDQVKADADKDLRQQLLQLRRRESDRRWISELLD
jgi:hypothetical protein